MILLKNTYMLPVDNCNIYNEEKSMVIHTLILIQESVTKISQNSAKKSLNNHLMMASEFNER